MIDALKSQISNWHQQRKITINGNSSTQTIKLGEEYGVLCAAIVRSDKREVSDALGDMFVVMVAIAELEGLDLEMCIQDAYDEIRNRTGELNSLGNWVKD